jgi:uncharacterized protein YgbK (DUF1537 family)
MIFIIADDLTGACDTGAGFAARGLSTLVQIGPSAGNTSRVPTADVLVFNTESRALSQAQAIEAVRDAATLAEAWFAQPQSTTWAYKKIDSTLRGHPGAELRALMEALQTDRALVTPAFPAQGRTVWHGQLLVQGCPLSQTVFAGEGALGDLRAAFATTHLALHDLHQGAPKHSLAEAGIYLADAQTNEDLRELVRAASASGLRLLCGSAGLATALANALTPAHLHPTTPGSTTGPVLIVAGSMNPTTARQVHYAQAHGVGIFRPTPGRPDADARLIDALVARLAQEGRAILTTCDLPASPLGRAGVAQALGALTAQVARRIALGGLVLTGGDVATAVCNALGTSWLSLRGEAQPGIAIGQLADGPYAGTGTITKAGGFGGEDALTSFLALDE